MIASACLLTLPMEQNFASVCMRDPGFVSKMLSSNNGENSGGLPGAEATSAGHPSNQSLGGPTLLDVSIDLGPLIGLIGAPNDPSVAANHFVDLDLSGNEPDQRPLSPSPSMIEIAPLTQTLLFFFVDSRMFRTCMNVAEYNEALEGESFIFPCQCCSCMCGQMRHP
ncbi:unnamed protein product [Dibothriocephalus latus]|uniref:Uncharacterized protein n=1 Tax=Dibothriocephalus latus TaxID=60516 RepID=A0A3P7QMC6_DIBLA|nr:unnamed protein product [Dibothriocephalus latus]